MKAAKDVLQKKLLKIVSFDKLFAPLLLIPPFFSSSGERVNIAQHLRLQTTEKQNCRKL